MSDRNYLKPDYSPDELEHPKESDDEDILESITDSFDEDDVKIEQILDRQANENNTSTINMVNNNNAPLWGEFDRSTNNEVAPWEKKTQTNNIWSGWNNTSTGWGSNISSTSTSASSYTGTPLTNKKAIVCDILDCLYESYTSNGQPDIFPRTIYDLKPKFNVWERILSFSPIKIYLMFPSPDIIPSFSNKESSNATLNYISLSITTFLRISRSNCIIFKQMGNKKPKTYIVNEIIKNWGSNRLNELLYIGIHSGKYGLSSKDKDIARQCKIDYIDIFNLINGKYEIE